MATNSFAPRASDGEPPPRPDFSNWGRWGYDDEHGAANHLTPETVLAALSMPSRGEIIPLAQVIGDRNSPRNRAEPQHFMMRDGGDFIAGAKAPGGFQSATDHFGVATHGVTTHIDALGHAWYDDHLYNGYSHDTVRSSGLRKLGIDKTPPLITRGVLIDLPRHRGVPRLEAGYEITADDVAEVLAATGTELAAGDAVLIRTGWITTYLDPEAEYHGDRPGIGLSASEYLARHDVTIVGADNSGVEVIPWAPGTVCPVHQFLIRDCGIYLLEFLDLEELSRHETPTFLFIALPLRLRGGTGSPLSPIAVL